MSAYLDSRGLAHLWNRLKERLNGKADAGHTHTPAEVGADTAGAAAGVQAALTAHTGDKSNPHGVTKAQVGLGNVPNVTTNNQAPTYTAAAALAALKSGETLTLAFGKLARGVSDLIAHLANKSNPHGVTADQAGAVPTGRKVNGKALTADITLAAADVGAVPTGRTVNGKALSGNLSLTAADVAAVPLAGGTMTGELKFKRGAWTGAPVVVKDDGDANGAGLVIQAGGLTVVGGGEAASNLYTALGLTGGTEQLHLASDTTLALHTNCQTIANRKTVTVTAAGAVQVPANTDYTTYKARNIAAGTTDLTAGTSALANGNVYLVYE